MKHSDEKICKILDIAKLFMASIALMISVGGLYYKSMGLVYKINVNFIVTYLLAGFVMATGIKVRIQKTNPIMGLFLMLCAIMIGILNLSAN